MALKVIGAGWGRTGTKTLQQALTKLGFGPCHHMEELLASEEQVDMWHKVAQGQLADWDKVFHGFNSAVDWPGAHYWRELADAYPSAKVILTTRDPEAWWRSYEKTILQTHRNVTSMESEPPPHVKKLTDVVVGTTKKTFTCEFDDKDSILEAFNAYEGKVREFFANEPERLLVYQVHQGYEPLCEFLGSMFLKSP
jgi:hypothetical protein